jgi:hypothetical protein
MRPRVALTSVKQKGPGSLRGLFVVPIRTLRA